MIGGWYPVFFDDFSTSKLNDIVLQINSGKVGSIQMQYDRNSELAKKIAEQIQLQTGISVKLLQSSPPDSTMVNYERNRVTAIIRSK
jgi:endonuclease G